LRAILEEALRADPVRSEDALNAIQFGADGEALNLEGLRTAARLFGRPVEVMVVETLAARSLLRAFTLAMSVRGAQLAEGWQRALEQVSELREIALDAHEEAGSTAFAKNEPTQEEPDADGAEEDEEEEDSEHDLLRTTLGEGELARLETLVQATRCRIRVDGRVVGSGSLVGPSTVLTAWHVIRDAEADNAPRVDVDLADGSRVAAVLPARFHSRCGDRELKDLLPENDNEVADAHDIALLQLRRPVGASLGYVRLADSGMVLRTRDALSLIHYPSGRFGGLSQGIVVKLRGLTSRWGHSMATRQGSSGGGCVNSRLLLVGVHQGRVPPRSGGSASRGRFVPVTRFPSALLELIRDDEAPPAVWSLDGTVQGRLVLGRRDLFAAFVAASRAGGRIRGIHVRRLSAEADTAGIPFTALILDHLVARGTNLLLVAVRFEEAVADLAEEVLQRARLAGLEVGELGVAQGVAPEQTTLEAAISDRARRAAVLLDAAAGRACRRVWIFIENPSAVFGEALRVGFEAFVDQALRLENLRLVIAGFEVVTIPGQAFRYATDAERPGPPGLMTEFLDGFRRADVEHLVRTASADLSVPVYAQLLTHIVDKALEAVTPRAGVYTISDAKEVVRAIRPELVQLARRSPQPEAADED
jgi:V8-like Glu-specific endopeptidase